MRFHKLAPQSSPILFIDTYFPPAHLLGPALLPAYTNTTTARAALAAGSTWVQWSNAQNAEKTILDLCETGHAIRVYVVGKSIHFSEFTLQTNGM